MQNNPNLSSVLDDAHKTVQTAFSEHPEINISQIAHELQERHSYKNIALEDFLFVVMLTANQLQATVYFDGVARHSSEAPQIFDSIDVEIVARKNAEEAMSESSEYFEPRKVDAFCNIVKEIAVEKSSIGIWIDEVGRKFTAACATAGFRSGEKDLQKIKTHAFYSAV